MKKLCKNCKGFTLVEIMVTFILTGIFMSAAAMALSTFMRSHTVASAVATEQSVASIVMETAADALSAASGSRNSFSDDTSSFHPPACESVRSPSEDLDGTEKDDCSLLVRAGNKGSEVWYVDGETDNVVRMYVKDVEENGESKGYLAMDYYIRPEDTATPGEWKKSPWQLGTGVYQHCSIEGFTVDMVHLSHPSGASTENSSCLSITLVLKNKLAGDDHTFTLKRAFDCYNLAPKNIVVKKLAG